MLIDDIIKICSHLNVLIVVAVIKSFPFTPRLQQAQLLPSWNCRRALNNITFAPAAALVLFLNSLREVLRFTW